MKNLHIKISQKYKIYFTKQDQFNIQKNLQINTTKKPNKSFYKYQDVKDSYQSKLDARVKKLGNQFEIKKEHRKQHNEILGKLQRAKTIF